MALCNEEAEGPHLAWRRRSEYNTGQYTASWLATELLREEENVLPAPLPAEVPQVVTTRSWTLTLAVLILALLPVILPFPLYDLAAQWFFPAIRKQLEQCGPISLCQAVTDGTRQVWLLILGPSFLAAMIALLLGTIGLIRDRWRSTSPKNRALFWFSAFWGTICMVFIGCMYALLFYLASIHDS